MHGMVLLIVWLVVWLMTGVRFYLVKVNYRIKQQKVYGKISLKAEDSVPKQLNMIIR